MDLLVYCLILIVVGFIKVSSTAAVSDDVGVAETVSVETCDLPIGNNLALKKEVGAYTLILYELGLVK